MSIAPLISAPLAVQIHLGFALIALCCGPVALYRHRRDRLHKRAGYGFASGILGLSISGLFIESGLAVVAHFGPIHLLSVYALLGLWSGLRDIWRGDIARHRRTMRQLWYGAIGVAGLFTLMPGRLLNQAVFGAPSTLGFGLIALGLAGLGWLWWRERARVTATPRGGGGI